MAKKSGKASTPAEKRRKAPKGQVAAADAAEAGDPKAAVVKVGTAEGTAAEAAGIQTAPVEGADPEAPGAEAAADAPGPAPDSAAAPAEACGGSATAEATSRPKGRGKTGAPKTGQVDAAAQPDKLSALDAAAKVLAEAGAALTCQEMIAAMAAGGYWASPGGKTPAATLYSAILRETQTKGARSRFTKAERGKFGLAARG
jgi:hypothetical protein